MSPSLPRYDFLHRQDIQGIRGLAVLLVVLYHAGLPVSGGFVGVDVFFVISGFVITGGILKILHSEKEFSFKDFYLRRTRRLLPALSFVLTSVTLVAVCLGPDVAQKFSGRTAVAASLLNANHYLYRGAGYFDPAAELNLFLHTWSLSVEEQFYLFFPFFIVTLWSLGVRRKVGVSSVLGIGTLALILATLCLCVWMSYTPSIFGINTPRLAFFTSITRAWEFGAGALVAILLPKVSARNSNLEPWGWIGFIFVLISAFLYTKDTIFPGISALLPVIGSAFLILPGIRKNSMFSAMFGWKPLVRMGDLSYAWYLWHWPLIVFAQGTWPGNKAVVAGVGFGSIGLAWLTERYIESPIRFRRVENRKPAWVVATVCVSAPILAWAVQTTLVEKAPLVVPELGELRSLEAGYRNIGCLEALEYSNSEECRWGDPRAAKVVLLGDSNARQFIPVLRGVTQDLGLQLHAATYPSCPLVGQVHSNGLVNQTCLNWREETITAILKEKPALVLMSMATELYVHDERRGFQNRTWTARERLEYIRTQMSKLTARFAEAGVSLIVLESVPKFYTTSPFSYPNPSHCSAIGILTNPSGCGAEMTREEAIRRIDSVTLDVGEVPLMDDICPDAICRMKVDQTWNYVDGGHLNSNGVHLLRSRFKELLTTRLTP